MTKSLFLILILFSFSSLAKMTEKEKILRKFLKCTHKKINLKKYCMEPFIFPELSQSQKNAFMAWPPIKVESFKITPCHDSQRYKVKKALRQKKDILCLQAEIPWKKTPAMAIVEFKQYKNKKFIFNIW
ncbi:MAG: hypothetical protein D6797_01655 [Bdellovibrio sp.]|nr:MAG: hypothetical protein D6797_01655 [Bdellovibrio sp.]